VPTDRQSKAKHNILHVCTVIALFIQLKRMSGTYNSYEGTRGKLSCQTVFFPATNPNVCWLYL